MKVALVHDWLTGMRGGEKVLEVLCERFPKATLFTLVHVPGSVSPAIARLPIRTSFVQHLPLAARFYREYLPLFPAAVEQFDFDAFDVVVSSSHCVAKGAIARAGVPHLCYCHTPMRYAWDQFDQYFGPARVGPLASAALRHVMAGLARWDRSTAGRVGRYVTNSHYVADRIRRYYTREAIVLYPPVNVDFFRPDGNTPGRYALVVSALVPYKRIDVAIDASSRAGIPLKIVGDGPERGSLMRRVAATNADVQFLGRRQDDEIRDLYRGAAMFLLPGEEDFGITAVEAQACGRPVVAFGRGGARETVVHGETGLLVEEITADALAASMADAAAHSFDSGAIRRHAEQFGRDRFGDAIEALVDQAWAAGRTS